MPFYEDAVLKSLRDNLAVLRNDLMDVTWSYIRHAYRVERAEEYAQHGFGRRMQVLLRCVENVFELIPPEDSAFPSDDNRTNAEINIQAFVLNVYGCLDNLAWIFVLEREVVAWKGEPIPPRHIGLAKENISVRRSLSPDICAYLDSLETWFTYLKDFRHALAHRIPLYIPPFALAGGKKEFRPIIIHSYNESPGTIAFHVRLISDLQNVIEVAKQMRSELTAL